MRNLYGRRKIKTDETVINRDNVVSVLTQAMMDHQANAMDIDYLWNYYKGKTPIIGKTKEYRDSINNIINENRALQIVEFYQGYIFGEPIQYIRSGSDESVDDEVKWLNQMMKKKGKVGRDNELAEWLLVCGVAPRMILPASNGSSVWDMYTLDPRCAFNIYFNDLGENVAASVTYITRRDGGTTHYVYTHDKFFEVSEGVVTREEAYLVGMPPIEEYCLNNVRMGIFEPAIRILDAIDNLQSNRMDDVQQFVDSILCILGGEINEDTLNQLKEWGALNLPEGVDAKYLNSVLSQSDIQTLKSDLMTAVTEITGIPNRNGGSSTSDTGSAVLLRDGWEIADAKAKKIETIFKDSERRMLELIYRIAYVMFGAEFTPDDVDIKFTRRNYEGIQTKSQVLTTMLNCGKIHPELAFIHCGMFADPQEAYMMSMKYMKETEAKYGKGNNGEEKADGETGGENDPEKEKEGEGI